MAVLVGAGGGVCRVVGVQGVVGTRPGEGDDDGAQMYAQTKGSKSPNKVNQSAAEEE